jgi:hypothetical protein
MMENDKFYSAFGVLTVAFSRMEADLRTLISGIAFGDKSVVASAFLDTSQLSENLRILRKLSRQYWDEEREILDVIKAIESVRETRNLFIHGIWHPGSFGHPSGFATVADLKTTYKGDNAERSWSHSQTLQFSISDFQNILDSVNEVIGKIEKVCDLFSSNDEIQFGQGGFTATLKPVIISLLNSISNSDNERMEPSDDER